MPIVALTQAVDFVDGLLSGGSNLTNPDDFFANFVPVSGGTLIDNEIGHYPFANQQVAANSIIAQPLTISMKMICPVRPGSSYATKLATLTALQSLLINHNTSGGTYTVATPGFIYSNCLMTSFKDISGEGDIKQAQYEWQLDFEQPLLTLAQAQAAQNSLMSLITGQTAVSGDPPGYSNLSTLVGQPGSLAGSSVVPSASGAFGAGVAGAQGPSSFVSSITSL